MLTSWLKISRMVVVPVLITVFAVQPGLLAQVHIVSPAELQKASIAVTCERKQNVRMVTEFLSSAKAQQALQSSQMDLTKVKSALVLLSDEELAQLASRAERAQADFVAGRLADRDLLLILLGMAALILIIVAVH